MLLRKIPRRELPIEFFDQLADLIRGSRHVFNGDLGHGDCLVPQIGDFVGGEHSDRATLEEELDLGGFFDLFDRGDGLS